MAQGQPGLRPLEKLGLIFHVLWAFPTLFSIVALGLPRAIHRGIPLRFWLLATTYRIVLGCFKPREIQFLATPTLEVYSAWVAKQKAKESKNGNVTALSRLHQDIEPLGTEAGTNNVATDGGSGSIMWLGNRKKASKFVLFFHGGGYIAPLAPGHLTWCWESYVNGGPGGADGGEVAVAVLQYTLCPGATYPTQLQQAAAALNHLLGSGVTPENLIIGGDSAGGNLTAQVLCHLLRPHPDVEPVRLTSPLAGTFLVSPFLSLRTDAVTFRDNHRVDMLSAAIVANGGNYLFADDHAQKQATNPHEPLALDGDMEWFGEIHTIAKSVYVTAGAQEVFCNDSRVFAEAVRRRNPGLNVQLEVAATEVHDGILIESEFGMIGDASQRMRSWASKCLC
ncbi:alpha/beta hydrolase [Colletotrichum phormii]|uniref:Alpha/beta hydrolase n=1 Tax=Colletotrichum phormii TaxID=359342 RepID=A0AAJ0EJI7_9PEZI|nr:alpha/beta hydrolase [Colletotrichum phormii]KAK1639086.1 alpha/beta hydrolase [Colletotrichum phormii]